MVSVPQDIYCKNNTKTVLLENNITINSKQLKVIRKRAKFRTLNSWKRAESGISISLTKAQRSQIVAIKNTIVNFITPNNDPEEFIKANKLVTFGKHANERIIERLEPLTDEERKQILSAPSRTLNFFIHSETLVKISEAFIKSTEVNDQAIWKGHPYLTYTFSAPFDQKEIEMSVVFDNGIFFVTLINTKESGYYIGETNSGRTLKDRF